MSGSLTLVEVLFYLVALGTVGSAAYAVLSSNIVRAVFSLLGTFFGVALLYGFLAADFLAVVQLMVYVGGILVLMLFAVMLTNQIEQAAGSNRAGGVLAGVTAGALMLLLLLTIAFKAPWFDREPGAFVPTTASIGAYLLGPALLPFEVLSVVLVGIVVGAVVIARRRSQGSPEAAGAGAGAPGAGAADRVGAAGGAAAVAATETPVWEEAER